MADSVARKSLEPYLPDGVLFYPHQVAGVRELVKRRNFLLADEMGLGKSLQALTVFIVDVMHRGAESAVVVCPATLKGNWADEIEKFTRLNWVVLGFQEKDGKIRTLSKEGREKQLIEFALMPSPKVLITNYEQILVHLGELNGMRFDVGIYDEAHYLKNPRAKRTKAAHGLRTKRTFLLTGSPLLNHVNELWSLLHKLDPVAYPKYWSFVNRYAVFGGYQDKQIVGVKNESELIERIDRIMVRRLKKDVLDLPEVQVIQRRVDLSNEQQKLYDEVIEDLRITIPRDPDPMEIENALTKFLRLKQICATTLPFTDEDHSNKLDLVVQDIMALREEGYRVVVFTQFRAVIMALERRLNKEGVSPFVLHGDVAQQHRQPLIAEWSVNTVQAPILCMMQVAGLGLNMTAARHCMFVDKLFVPLLNQQAVDRLHRIGADKTQPVQVFEYITRNTVENRVEAILRTKSKIFNTIIEMGDFRKKLIEALMEEEVA